MNIRKAVILIVAAHLLVSCKSASVRSAKPIRIPSGLDVQQVKLGIAMAVHPGIRLEDVKKLGALSDENILSLCKDPEVGKRGVWYIEDIGDNSLLVGYSIRSHYIRVEYAIGETEIVQRIDGSKNLRQTRYSIHRNAFVWIGQMETRIRQSMGRLRMAH